MESAVDKGHRAGSRLLVVLLLILGVRLLLAWLVYGRPELAVANDSDRYIPLANAILGGSAYAWTTDRPGELLNTVGYPLFLAGVFATAGTDAGDIAFAQLLLTGGLALSLYLVLAARIGERAAFAGALLLALDPLTALWSMTILTETLFAATLGLAACMLAAWTHDKKWTLILLAGFVAALACLVKPLALPIAAWWAACLLFFPRAATGNRGSYITASLRTAALFTFPVVLLVAPWFVRNALLWDCATLSSVDRVTMRDYMAAKVLSEANHIELAEAQAQLQATDPGVCPTQTTKYLQIIMANPGIYARLHAAGTVPLLIATNFDRWLQYFGEPYVLPDLWRPYMDDGVRGLARLMRAELANAPTAVGLMFGLTLFQVVLYILAIWGAVAALRRPEREFKWIALLLMGTIAILVLTPGQGGHERFRVPVQPMLAILVSYGVAAKSGLNLWR